jgi:adenylate cyclase
LNSIFSTFDQLTKKYGLEKIKTIRDAYLIVGGVPIHQADHAEAIANMAIAMQQAIKQFRTPQGEPLSLCIGINTGAVVAGVIGTKKFSYDLWGDTVNVASRMQSHTPADSVQVTEATYQQLRDQYLFEERGLIPVKGKGMMKTYLLISRKPDAKEPRRSN